MNRAKVVVQGDASGITGWASQASHFDYPTAATLTKHEVCSCIEDVGIVPSLVEASTDDAAFVAAALTEAGIPIIEVSFNLPNAIDIVSHLVEHVPTIIVGVGSVRNTGVARRCLDAGAKFLSTDGLIPGVVEFALNEKVTGITGALTLTEIISTWDAGTDFVKVVPCHAVGGHNYIRALQASVPQARLIAAGGINELTAANYITAGCAALGIGKALIPTEAILLRQTRRIQELARRFLSVVDKGRT
jgi:2-dehydro-3-deoxyphosphogluconate aldolase / (4S)-4-hydroxy-2-oxoglutarate aldolase